MRKSVVIKKFNINNRYVIHPELIVKDSGSFAIPPYLVGYNFNTEELLEKILYALDFSKEGSQPSENPKDRVKNYLNGMGIKTMKELYSNTFSLDVYLNNNIIEFNPWENAGAKQGFIGFEENLSVQLPFASPKEELLKALELALSRCK